MNIIYLHGLDSGSNANKAIITTHHAEPMGYHVHRPDLNCPPDDVVAKIRALIIAYPDAVLIGSSLGGYFATLMSDLTGVPAVLLNPSIRPDVSFRRFLADNFDGWILTDEQVIYTTIGGWQIRYGDLAWFEKHRLVINYPKRLKVLLKLGDELLDASATYDFYQERGVAVLAQDGGDHTMSDYEDNIIQVLTWVEKLRA